MRGHLELFPDLYLMTAVCLLHSLDTQFLVPHLPLQPLIPDPMPDRKGDRQKDSPSRKMAEYLKARLALLGADFKEALKGNNKAHVAHLVVERVI